MGGTKWGKVVVEGVADVGLVEYSGGWGEVKWRALKVQHRGKRWNGRRGLRYN